MIARENCKINMTVLFGRPNGEKTRGIIKRLNQRTCAVETTEARGTQKTVSAGKIWKVPYELLYSVNGDSDPKICKPIPEPSLDLRKYYDPIDKGIIELIVNCYVALSPENLTCDGELPAAQVRARSTFLRKKLEGLFIALGQRITEDQALDYVLNNKRLFAER